jgi:hypothetical protein
MTAKFEIESFYRATLQDAIYATETSLPITVTVSKLPYLLT